MTTPTQQREEIATRWFKFVVLLFVLVTLADFCLYVGVVIQRGPQWQHWPGSGIYLAWKHRGNNE